MEEATCWPRQAHWTREVSRYVLGTPRKEKDSTEQCIQDQSKKKGQKPSLYLLEASRRHLSLGHSYTDRPCQEHQPVEPRVLATSGATSIAETFNPMGQDETMLILGQLKARNQQVRHLLEVKKHYCKPRSLASGSRGKKDP